jgi:hypothetical protein
MGHMDDDGEPTVTVKVFWPNQGTPETFRGCTSVDNDGGDISFVDSSGKRHQCFGVTCEVLEE